MRELHIRVRVPPKAEWTFPERPVGNIDGPESVLIVIHTDGGEFLLLERRRPAGFWQSVTAVWSGARLADRAARREVAEETGIAQGVLVNLQWTQVSETLPAFGKVYAPGITRNLEHAFSLEVLPQRVPVTLSDREHVRFRWGLGRSDAVERASSSTDRAVIRIAEELRGKADAESDGGRRLCARTVAKGRRVGIAAASTGAGSRAPARSHFRIHRLPRMGASANARALGEIFESRYGRILCTWWGIAWAAR